MNGLNLIVDIGNTVVKIAVFERDEMLEFVSDSNSIFDKLHDIMAKYPIERGIVSSVIDLNELMLGQLNSLGIPLIWLDYQTPIPLTNLYETPQTLGADRIAAVVGATNVFPNRDLLVIDAGTCITYEFVDSEGCYHGGNISPGLQMRLKALHQFSGRLPLIQSDGRTLSLGKDTETAIRSGVIKGIEYEIMGYIRELKEKYPQLLVFLTGGDGFSFETSVKNVIFADRFLVLKGLNRILNYNNDRI